MKLITRDTDYAVRALSFILRHREQKFSATDLVRALKIPRPFLRKILQELTNQGILKSYRGQGGGFTLTPKSRGVTLIDLIKIFQGPFELNECFFKKLACPNKNSCALRKKIGSIEKEVFSKLSVITIASLSGRSA
ncbi:MAG TPA: Rrf2 family transcriptional regulator [Candidatus Margulisiibacteriota bacterium]|nr:Rrf2 family transcriptional regulator [Candidatus Margulisiibacteriota bacterium]